MHSAPTPRKEQSNDRIRSSPPGSRKCHVNPTHNYKIPPSSNSAPATTQLQNATWTVRGGDPDEPSEPGEPGDVIVDSAYPSPREKLVGVLAVQQVHPTDDQHRSE